MKSYKSKQSDNNMILSKIAVSLRATDICSQLAGDYNFIHFAKPYFTKPLFWNIDDVEPAKQLNKTVVGAHYQKSESKHYWFF